MKIKIKNPRVVIYSLIAIGFIVLTFVFDEWLFIIGAVVLWYLNQRELNKMKRMKRKK